MFQKLIAKIRGMSKLFLWVVVVPTTLAILYFGFIASPVYMSQSRFVIYSPNERSSSSGLGGLLNVIGGTNSNRSAEILQSYFDSWAAMKHVNRKLDIAKIYGNSNVDIFDRYGGIFHPFRNDVSLYRYYRTMVQDNLNTSTGISELGVKAYTPEDARAINQYLLKLGQRIVNQLNQEARQKSVSYAERSVAKAEAKFKEVSLALTRFRNSNQVFSPNAQSSGQLNLIEQLQTQYLAQKAQLEALRQHAPDNPQVPVLEGAVQSLKKQIMEEQNKMTGSNDSLASKDRIYENLKIQQSLAQKLLEAAFTSLQQARTTAQKQTLYLETISPPNLSDAPQGPERLKGILATLAVTLMIWGVLTVVIGGIKEHHER